jgi:serine/threonine protein kinase
VPHTMGVGSPPYTAPEQMAGCNCDAACDAFAVGIVFVEMYYAFATASERISVLTAAGRGRVDAETIKSFPELAIAAGLATPSRRQRWTIEKARRAVRTAYLRIAEELDMA